MSLSNVDGDVLLILLYNVFFQKRESGKIFKSKCNFFLLAIEEYSEIYFDIDYAQKICGSKFKLFIENTYLFFNRNYTTNV